MNADRSKNRNAALVVGGILLLILLTLWVVNSEDESGKGDRDPAAQLADERNPFVGSANGEDDEPDLREKPIDERRPEEPQARVGQIHINGRVFEKGTGLSVNGATVNVTNAAPEDRTKPKFPQSWTFAWIENGEARYDAPPMRLAATLPTRFEGLDEPSLEDGSRTATGSDGRFSVTLDANTVTGTKVLIGVTHSEYAAQIVQHTIDPADGEERSIYLAPVRRLEGRVRFEGDGNVRTEGSIAFLGSGGEGIWSTTLSSDGRFVAWVGANQVIPKLRTPGWILTWPIEPIRGQSKTVDLTAVRVPLLVVRDRVSGEPIQQFRVLWTVENNGARHLAGEFRSPEGLLPLVRSARSRSLVPKIRSKIQVWTDGYAPWCVRPERVLESDVFEAYLERGDASMVQGLVLRSGEAVEGAVVSLHARSLTMPPTWWIEGESVLSSGRTGVDGVFELNAAPEGFFFLRVQSGAIDYVRELELPLAEPLTIDFETLTGLRVRLIRGDKPLFKEEVRVTTGKKRLLRHLTDTNGYALFRGLPPGEAEIRWNRVRKKVELLPGGEETLEIEVGQASESKRLCYFVTDTGQACDGWKIKEVFGDHWGAIGLNGAYSLRVSSRMYRVEIRNEDGQGWTVPIDPDFVEGQTFTLKLEGVGFEVFLSERQSGRGIDDCRVTVFRLDRQDIPWITATSNRDGVARIVGLELIEGYFFQFSNTHGGVLHWLDFAPKGGPGDPLRKLELRLPLKLGKPDLPLRELEGVVYQDGAVVKSARVTVATVWEEEEGTYFVSAAQVRTANTQEDGVYRLLVPEGTLYRANVEVRGDRKSVLSAEWKVREASGPISRNFHVE